MSYDVHEAFCLDSFMDQLLFWDDFEGDSLKDLWATSGTGTGVVVDQQTGGIVRLTTGATNGNNFKIFWGDLRSLLVSKKVTMECRVKLNQTTAITLNFELHEDASDRIMFVATAGGNWFIHTESGGAITTEDTGDALDTDYHVFRIECFPTGEVHFYIDNSETANSPLTTNITASYLEPELKVTTTEDVAKSIDIDYVYVRQER